MLKKQRTQTLRPHLHLSKVKRSWRSCFLKLCPTESRTLQKPTICRLCGGDLWPLNALEEKPSDGAPPAPPPRHIITITGSSLSPSLPPSLFEGHLSPFQAWNKHLNTTTPRSMNPGVEEHDRLKRITMNTRRRSFKEKLGRGRAHLLWSGLEVDLQRPSCSPSATHTHQSKPPHQHRGVSVTALASTGRVMNTSK